MQGPDIRPKALGLWSLFGLGDQLLLLQPCLPAVLLRLIPLCVFCWVNLLSLSLVTLLGVWCLFQGFLQVEEVQGSMLTAEWPLGVLIYTSESTVSWDIWTVISTSLHVLLQEAETSGPWIAGRVFRLLQFLYVFPWAMLQNILGQCYLQLCLYFLVFALDFFLVRGFTFATSILGAYHVFPCFIIMLNFMDLLTMIDLILTLSHRGIFTFSGKSILLPFIFKVVLSHFMYKVSHKVCFSSWRFWALSCPLRAKVCSKPLSSLSFTGT